MDVNNFRFGDPNSPLWGGFSGAGAAPSALSGMSPSDPAFGLTSLLTSLSQRNAQPGTLPNTSTPTLASALTGTQPEATGWRGMLDKSGLGMNVKTAQLALSGLDTIGSLWGGFAARDLANKNFNFQKDFAEKNYANQLKSYNSAVEDRGRSRAIMEGQSDAEAREYIQKNKLG